MFRKIMCFSISELSKKCAYSTDHLRVLFKNNYDISPQEYRIRRIMAYAMELICKSNLMVSDIADKCGFKYLSHFSSLFKKIHGISPATALKTFPLPLKKRRDKNPCVRRITTFISFSGSGLICHFSRSLSLGRLPAEQRR